MSRPERSLRRARYAAVGGAIGRLTSRNAASTGAGMGGLLGATVAEKREAVDGVIEGVRGKRGW